MKIKKFPIEFEDLLNRNGKNILKGKANKNNFGKKGNTPIEIVKDIIDKDISADCIKILHNTFYGSLKKITSKIDPDEISKMKKNYSERLSKNLRMKTLEIGGEKSKTYESAYKCGLIQMLNSQSLKAFGEAVANEKFGSAQNNQIICYQQGDYVSPHNDHHPEYKNIKNGYFDIHIMFSNENVQHQLLVYEKNGLLNATYDLSIPSAIAIYKLPFWHYTTPLLGKSQYEDLAQRWLLLRSFETYQKLKQ